MNAETLTCPYCNAVLNSQDGWSPGQRIVCPRCGDAFPLRSDFTFTDRKPSPPRTAATAITADAPDAGLSLPPRWTNRQVAGVVLGVMLLMAGVGLAFMLVTQGQRRSYDTNRPARRPGKQQGVPEPENVASLPVIASVAPDKLAALGYLPPGVNFLLAARVPELLAGPAGAEVLHAPIQLGESSFHLENLPKWLGFRLEEIDHIVFAARIDNSILPPFYVVLRTSEPYVEEQLRQRLKGKRMASNSKKSLFAFRIPKPDVPLTAWCADTRTVVLALFADQLEPLPPQPVQDLQQLPEELRTLLQHRREPAAPAWIAGHSARDWDKTSASLVLNRMKKEDVKRLATLRTFGLFIVPNMRANSPTENGNENGALVITGIFACKDESSARELGEHFRALRGPDPSFKTALDGSWLMLQFRAGLDSLPLMFKR